MKGLWSALKNMSTWLLAWTSINILLELMKFGKLLISRLILHIVLLPLVYFIFLLHDLIITICFDFYFPLIFSLVETGWICQKVWKYWFHGSPIFWSSSTNLITRWLYNIIFIWFYLVPSNIAPSTTMLPLTVNVSFPKSCFRCELDDNLKEKIYFFVLVG